MMQELVDELSQKTGLSPEKSQEVVNVVVSHLKARLPEPFANGLDTLLAGGQVDTSGLAEKAMSMAAGFFNKKAE